MEALLDFKLAEREARKAYASALDAAPYKAAMASGDLAEANVVNDTKKLGGCGRVAREASIQEPQCRPQRR